MVIFFAIQFFYTLAISATLFLVSLGIGFFAKGWIGWTILAVLTAAVLFWSPQWVLQFIPTDSASFAKELESMNLKILWGGWLLGGAVGLPWGIAYRRKRASTRSG